MATTVKGKENGMRGIPEQYSQLKGECDGYILLMQVGNFLLLFGKDAEAISLCSQVKLVPSGSLDNPVAKAGIPIVALDKYVGKLLRSGHKMAIALQKKDENGNMRRVITERLDVIRALPVEAEDEKK